VRSDPKLPLTSIQKLAERAQACLIGLKSFSNESDTINLNSPLNPPPPLAQVALEEAIADNRPLVAVLGQSLGYTVDDPDRTFSAGLTKLGIKGSSWNDIFSSGALTSDFYQWLNERFERRSPSRELIAISDTHFSAVYTSSFDPLVRNLFETDGRQPEAIVLGDPPPPISRSKRRPRIFYLFGILGAGRFQPPATRLALKARLTQHAMPMLNTMIDVATPLGIITVDGFRAHGDWLDPSEILGLLSRAPTNSVLWFGPDPGFDGADAELFSELVEIGTVLRDERPLSVVLAEIGAARGAAKPQILDEPGMVSFHSGVHLITTPSIRLSTEASAFIIDDAWMDALLPFNHEVDQENFSVFHSIPSSIRLLFDGIRRDYAIQRDFEPTLLRFVKGAINNHAKEKGAIVVSGQSGIGKSIALYRLATEIRREKSAAVLYARDRIPLAAELANFLSDVDKLNQVTLLIVDALTAPHRYDNLLESFRSRGHRVVIVGTSYSNELTDHRHNGRLVNVTSKLSKTEHDALLSLAEKYVIGRDRNRDIFNSDHILAHFFWTLPQSRARLALGLGREARSTERVLRERGRSNKTVQHVNALALALIQAGYKTEAPILKQNASASEHEDAAAKLIDYIMVCSRVYRWVPVNLVLRTLLSDSFVSQIGISTDLISELFDGHDIFRWRYDEDKEDQLLVGARLQLEAQLICDQRLGGPVHEVEKVIDLIANATRAGPDGGEETRFVADIVFALGPDGPLGTRYHERYSHIAKALTSLRKQHGVKNARLMLQEATLRRHYVRRNSSRIPEEESFRLLDEAREAVEEALSDISRPENDLRAGRRTIDNLWVERAATYGFVATSAARSRKAPDIVWANYLAAREAVRRATGKVDTYYPLDISLWTPIDILEANCNLSAERVAELRADVISTIDAVNEEDLDLSQSENFQKQRLRAGIVVSDFELSDDAFAALDAVGSTVGYFFRAKKLSPTRPTSNEPVTARQIEQADATASYLLSHKTRISDDGRCLRLLLNTLWLWKTKSWLFQQLRQPLPTSEADQRLVLDILNDLSHATNGDFSPRFRYLTAVLSWLRGDEASSIKQFRDLARETEYVDSKRVLPRHVITGADNREITFTGVVERRIGDQRWSVHVRELNRKVDLVEGRWIQGVSIGKELRGFGIAFNYLGPIADRLQ
jgi:hypothetical protein